MKLTTQQLKAYGLAIDGAVQDATLQTAIEVAELSVVKAAIGDTNYITLSSWEAADPRMAGGAYTPTGGSQVYLRGYLRSAAYLAFAHLLLLNDAQVTAFGTTMQKNDEYSQHIAPEQHARRYMAEGLKGIQEICDAMKWEYNSTDLQSCIM